MLSVMLAAIIALHQPPLQLHRRKEHHRGRRRLFGHRDGGDSTIAGTFDVQRFANRKGALVAIGNFVGTVTNPTTGAQTVVAPLALPVNTQATTATCAILPLVLGPLDLNLLGLRVQLNQVVLDRGRWRRGRCARKPAVLDCRAA